MRSISFRGGRLIAVSDTATKFNSNKFMATITFKGKAQINSGFGSATFDVITYAEPQTFNITDEFQHTKGKDRLGQDCTQRGQNEMYKGDIEFECLGDTKVNAAKLNTVAPGGFLPPLSTVTIAAVDFTLANGAWTCVSGQALNLKNDDIAKFKLPLEAYADPTQRTLMTSTPA